MKTKKHSMRYLTILGLICLQLIPSIHALDAFDFVYRFVDAKATSTNPGSSPDEFCPRRAIQAVMGYWCSEGNHDPDTVVTWIGTLNMKTILSGLQIRWAYSPKEVKIIVSNDDGVTERTALDWRATASDEPSFDETLTFSKPVYGDIVKICMRGSKESFYGINMVTPLSLSKPIVQIISGITSPSGEMCLQVANGDVFTDQTPVMLDYCSSAIAAGDGRELFFLNAKNQLQSVPSYPPKCLVLKGMNTTNGGNVVISDCDDALQNADGRSHWNFVSYGQIVLDAKNQSFCISQRGETAGFKNIVKDQSIKATASSVSDNVHQPDKALDGNPQTWWGSGSFPDFSEHRVLFDIDLGQASDVFNVRIDWEYPPLVYTLLVSSDYVDWTNVGGSKANPSNVTQVTLPRKKIQYIRLSLERPHPRYGVFKNKYLYGIRELQILKSLLETIVEDRYKAGNSRDARDKYFLVAVQEFNTVLSNKLTNSEKEFQSRLEAVQLVMEQAEELLPQMDKCLSFFTSNEEKMKTVINTSVVIQNNLQAMTMSSTENVRKQINMGLSLGDTKLLAAEDCVAIKKKNPNAQSGFYWLAPQCSINPFRGWCDMTSGLMFYVWTGNPSKKPNAPLPSWQVSTPESIQLRCAEMGLEPLTFRKKHDIETLILLLTKIGFDWTSNMTFPLSFDHDCFVGQCSGTFRDLATGSDLTSLLLNLASPSNLEKITQGYNTAGLKGRSVTFFNIEEAMIGGLICSTNTLVSDDVAQPITIECATTALTHPVFKRLTDTNVLLRCPNGCQEDITLPVYGSNYLYHERSSLCRAALHAGVIQGGGVFNIAIEGQRKEFVGTVQNGIHSKTLTADAGDRSIRIGPVLKTCPIDLLNAETPISSSSSSFLQLATLQAMPLEKKSSQKLDGSTSFLQTDVVESLSNITPEMNQFLNHIYHSIDEFYSLDPHILVLLKEQTAYTLGKTRGLLKPAEQFRLQQELSVLQLLQTTQSVAESVYDALGDSFTSLQFVLNQLERLLEIKKRFQDQMSWKFCSTRPPLNEVWEDALGLDTTGSNDWRYITLPTNESAAEPQCNLGIIQQGMVSRNPDAVGRGSFLLAKNNRFFDFTYTLKFIVRETKAMTQPIVGVAFRAKDVENMYLLELDGSPIQGAKRLIRLHNGIATVLLESKDGGFLPGVWYNIHVETLQGHLRICFGEDMKPLSTIFDFQDEQHASGTIGLFTANTSPLMTVMFGSINVQTKNCKEPPNFELSAPLPPGCNIFKDSYLTHFNSFYAVTDAPESRSGPSEWSYLRDIDGRSRVITQKSSIDTFEAQHPPATMAIIKRGHTCPHGQFTFEYFLPPRCKRIGVIFRYVSDNSYSLIEISQDYGIDFRIKFGTTFFTIKPEKEEKSHDRIHQTGSHWIKCILTFNGPLISVHLEKIPDSVDAANSLVNKRIMYRLDPSMTPVMAKATRSLPLRLGLTTSMCPGAMFDHVQAGPVDFFSLQEPQYLSLLTQSTPKATFGQSCIKAQSYLERQSLCVKLYNPDGEAIGTCCGYHTKILASHYYESCMGECLKHDVFSEISKKAWISALSLCLEDTEDSEHQTSYKNMSLNRNPYFRARCFNCCSSLPELQHLQHIRVDEGEKSVTSRPFTLNTVEMNKMITKTEPMEVAHCKEACQTSMSRSHNARIDFVFSAKRVSREPFLVDR